MARRLMKDERMQRPSSAHPVVIYLTTRPHLRGLLFVLGGSIGYAVLWLIGNPNASKIFEPLCALLALVGAMFLLPPATAVPSTRVTKMKQRASREQKPAVKPIILPQQLNVVRRLGAAMLELFTAGALLAAAILIALRIQGIDIAEATALNPQTGGQMASVLIFGAGQGIVMGWLVISAAYRGGSWCKRICGLRIVNVDRPRDPVGLMRAILREVIGRSGILLLLVFLLPYAPFLLAAYLLSSRLRTDRRLLHDVLANTAVVRCDQVAGQLEAIPRLRDLVLRRR